MGKKVKESDIKKALFTQRLFAFLIDVLIVYVIASFISMPFIDSKESTKLSNEAIEIRDKYMNGELSVNSYVSQFSSISYKIAWNTGVYSLITIVIEILYYIVYQLYNGGQTIGKKIMKTKIVSDIGNLEMNQMIFRSFLANFILLNIISFVFMLFTSKSTYFYAISFFEVIQYIIVFISIFLVMYSNDGRSLHDRFTKTRVISIK